MTQASTAGSETDVDPATAVFRAGDRVRLSFESNIDGYLYVVQEGSSGRWTVMFPNPDINGGRNAIRRGEEYVVPPDGWFQFDSTVGTELLFVVLSKEPLSELPGFRQARRETAKASTRRSSSRVQQSIRSRDLTFARDERPQRCWAGKSSRPTTSSIARSSVNRWRSACRSITNSHRDQHHRCALSWSCSHRSRSARRRLRRPKPASPAGPRPGARSEQAGGAAPGRAARLRADRRHRAVPEPRRVQAAAVSRERRRGDVPRADQPRRRIVPGRERALPEGLAGDARQHPPRARGHGCRRSRSPPIAWSCISPATASCRTARATSRPGTSTPTGSTPTAYPMTALGDVLANTRQGQLESAAHRRVPLGQDQRRNHQRSAGAAVQRAARAASSR